MRTIAVEEKEGEIWQDWEPYRFDRSGQKLFRTVHAIKFDNGVIWDAVNGFRKNTKPRFRVPMGRA